MNKFYKEKKGNRLSIMIAMLLTLIVLFFVVKVLIYYQEKKTAVSKEAKLVSKPGKDEIRSGISKDKLFKGEETSNDLPAETLKTGSKDSQTESTAIKTPKTQNKESLENYNNFSRGKDSFAAYNYPEAIKYYQAIDPKNFEVLKNLGISYYKTKKYDDAKDCLEAAVQKNRKDFLVLKYLSLILYEEEEFSEAQKYINWALGIQNDSELAFLKEKVAKERLNRQDYGKNTRVHFVIKYSRSDHSQAETQIVSYLEDAYREICQSLDFYPPDPTEVVLYTEKSFFDITRSPSWSGGLYDGRIKLPVGNIINYQRELKRILFHEFAHVLVRKMAKQCPLWLNEGLAEYLSRGPYEKTIGQIIPLNYLEFGFPSNTKAAQVAYMESYSVVKYLIDRYGLYRMKDLLEKLGLNVHFTTAFEDTYSITYKKFLNEWGKD